MRAARHRPSVSHSTELPRNHSAVACVFKRYNSPKMHMLTSCGVALSLIVGRLPRTESGGSAGSWRNKHDRARLDARRDCFVSLPERFVLT
jgi:hypothetical protein